MTVLRVDAPCGWINSNQRHHRMAVAALTKQWRQAGHDAAKGTPPICTPVRVVAHIYKTRAGRYDPNNLWPTVKAILDGVVDAGVIPDDDHHHVIGPDMRHGGKHPTPHITLTFQEAP